MAGFVCGMLGHLEQPEHKRVASTVPRLSTFSQRVCLLRHNLAIYLFKFTSWSHSGAALGLGSLSFGTGTHMVLKWVCRDGLIRSAGSRKLRWSVYFAGIMKSLRLMWKQANPTSPKSIWRWVFLFIGLINIYLCGSLLLMWIDVPDVFLIISVSRKAWTLSLSKPWPSGPSFSTGLQMRPTRLSTPQSNSWERARGGGMWTLLSISSIVTYPACLC